MGYTTFSDKPTLKIEQNKEGTLKGLTTPSLLLSESKAQQVTVLGTPNIYVSGHQVLTASSDAFQKKHQMLVKWLWINTY